MDNATNDMTGGRAARKTRITHSPKKKLFEFFQSQGDNPSFDAVVKHDIVKDIASEYSLKTSQV